MAKRTKTTKANGRALEIDRSHTFTMQPPPFATVEDVAEQLEETVAPLLFATSHLIESGSYCPPLLPFDLGIIAEAMAKVLRGGRAELEQDEPGAHVAELARAVSELRDRMESGDPWGSKVTYKLADGRETDVPGYVTDALAELLEQQAASLRGSLAKRWEAEDRSRRAGLEALLREVDAKREVARIRAGVA